MPPLRPATPIELRASRRPDAAAAPAERDARGQAEATPGPPAERPKGTFARPRRSRETTDGRPQPRGSTGPGEPGTTTRAPPEPAAPRRFAARLVGRSLLGIAALTGLSGCSGSPEEAAPAVQRAPAPTRAAQPRMDPLAEHDLEVLRPRRRLTWPTVIPHITSTFGFRINPITGAGSKLHRGLDLRGKTGDPVLSIGDGTIHFAGHDPFLGTCVIVDHGDGLTSWYGHLSDLLVYEGMPVERGAAIGLVGTTGRSQAPHLHLSIKIGETSVDPLFVLGAPAYAYPALVGDPDGETSTADATSP